MAGHIRMLDAPLPHLNVEAGWGCSGRCFGVDRLIREVLDNRMFTIILNVALRYWDVVEGQSYF